MRIVCISDTHNRHDAIEVPAGELLIHAGDFTMAGSVREIQAFDAWLGTLPHPHKVVIAGNHDWLFQLEPRRARALLENALYLEDAAATIGGLTLYGSPWQPRFFDWAFNLSRGPEIAAKWALIPDATDILITHGPPLAIGDRVRDGEHVGCADLGRALERVRPRLHVFGHIHEAYGLTERNGITFVNACNLDEHYVPRHAPLVIDL